MEEIDSIYAYMSRKYEVALECIAYDVHRDNPKFDSWASQICPLALGAWTTVVGHSFCLVRGDLVGLMIDQHYVGPSSKASQSGGYLSSTKS